MKLRRRHRNILRMIYKKKINLYLYAVTVEGFSINTIMNYKEEMRLFSNYLQTPTVQVTTTDIRNYLALNPNFKKTARWVMK